jgi:aminopeptidase N
MHTNRRETAVCCGALLLVAAQTISAQNPPAREVLPDNAVPSHYDLAIVPDADKLEFRGTVRISIDVKRQSPEITLNADDLTIDRATVDRDAAPAAVALDTKLQRASLTFAHPVAAGSHVLTIEYHGAIGKTTLGFFAMDYDTPQGKRRTLATNFEPASERRFMPSWDEPGLKATFSLTADIPPDRMAISNMPVASTDALPDGRKRVHFATTPKMSTYLFFFGVGDFERIATKVDGVDIGVVVNRGDSEKGRVALAEAAKILPYYNDYFGVKFPLPKLDLIVAPGSITGGSMENWGAIFYSQQDLLFDPKNSADADRQFVFEVVAHEMSHQWFGDLVTMDWWDNLWLNEGFARWMQTKVADDLHPEWRTGLQAPGISDQGKRADSKPSTHPIIQPVLTASQAEQAFDSITYEKGSAVIAMLEAYVGSNAFRDGVRHYMKAHAYGNTVDADLWREVQSAAGKPVLEIEKDFTTQPGLPLLRVESEDTKDGETRVAMREDRFAEDRSTLAKEPPQKWRIPVALSTDTKRIDSLLSPGSPGGVETVAVGGNGPAIVNAGQLSYVRVVYPQPVFEKLAAGLPRMQPADQLGLFRDAWEFGQSGDAPVTNYLELARNLPVGADPLVWQEVVPTFVSIDNAFADPASRAVYRKFVNGLLAPLAGKLGWDEVAGEDQNAAVLRGIVLRTLSRFGDRTIVEEARRRYAQALKDPASYSAATRRVAMQIVARNASGDGLDQLIARLKEIKDPLEKGVQLSALTAIADPEGAKRVLDVALSPDAPAGTLYGCLVSLAGEHPDLIWEYAKGHIDQPGFPLNSAERLRIMPAIAARSSDENRAGELQAYAEQHIPAGARRAVTSAVAVIKEKAEFRSARIPEIAAWVAAQAR